MAAITATGLADEEELRKKAMERLAGLRREQEQHSARLCVERRRSVISAARREAGLIRLRAEHAMALRLRCQAGSSLSPLLAENRQQILAALAAELPPAPWHTARVAPDDLARTAELFPGVTVLADEAISGGIAAATADHGLTVDNTLETRLERSWPDLLPSVMAEVRRLAQ